MWQREASDVTIGTVLFVWRHNNDFDSTLPLVHAIATRGIAERVFVHVSSPELAWRDDFRTPLVADLPNVEIFDIWSLVGGLLGTAVPALAKLLGGHKGPLRKLLPKLEARAILASDWRARLMAKIEAIDADLVAFDWVTPANCDPVKGPYGIREIHDWAKAKGRPTVALPHGLSLATFPAGGDDLGRLFDQVQIESTFHRDAKIAAGWSGDEVVVTGAARFDPAWIDELDRRIATAGLTRAPAPGRITIVFFATKVVYDFDFERVIDWLDRMAAMPEVRLVVQPHPRGQGKSRFARLMRRANVVVDMTTPAAILMREADVVSTLVSSVVCEAVAMGKPLLYPRFLNTLSTRFDEEGACVVVESMEDAEAAVKRCVEAPIPREAYDRFLAAHVRGGEASPIAASIRAMTGLVAPE